MKIRNSSRITAIVLALMMIVPLISVPTFAEEAATPVFTQDFESIENIGDAIKAQGTGNDSAVLKDLGGDRGKVFMFDLTNGADKAFGNNEADAIYVTSANSSGSGSTYKVTSYKASSNGKVTGYVTIDGTEYKFENATLNTETFATKSKLFTFVRSYNMVFDENFMPIPESEFDSFVGEEGKEYTVDQGYVAEIVETASETLATEYWVVTGQALNAIRGVTNIAQPNNVYGTENFTGSEFVFSADYYFSQDWAGELDVRHVNTNFEFARITVPNGNSSNVKVGPHNSDLQSCKDGETDKNAGILVAKETWFNLSVYVNGVNVEVYVNGKLAFSGYNANEFANIDMTTANKGWNLGHPARGGNALHGYAGYYMVDDIAIYEGKNGIPAESNIPAYINSMNFTRDTATHAFGSGVQWDYEHNVNNGTALKINADTYDETANADYSYATNVVDKNVFQQSNAPAIQADAAGNKVVMESDMFLVPGMTVKMEGQIRELKANGTTTALTSDPDQELLTTNGTFSWTTLYWIESDAKGASFMFSGMDANKVEYNRVLPTGVWFTISVVLDLTNGETELYVDGVLAATYTLYRNSNYLSNIVISANKGYIATKLSTMGKSGTTYLGHNSTYKTGYTDYVLVDNVETYKDLSLLKTSEYVSYDFEDRIWNVDDEALIAVVKGSSVVGPKTATYAYAPDGDLALKLDMTPADTGATTDVPFFGYGSRGYYAPVAVDSFDPDDGMDVNLEKLTVAYSGNSTNDKRIYYARVDKTVYVYMAGGNAVADETGSNLQYKGSYQIAPETEEGSGLYDLKYMECFQGGGNIDKFFTVRTPEYKYDATEGANNTYAFSASYYVAEDAFGCIESQFYGNYLDLYTLDLGAKKFYNKLNADVVGELLVDSWNKVDMIVTLTADDALVDVYLNGVYTHSTTYSAKIANHNYIRANDWIVAKVGKTTNFEFIADLNGSVYVDDVAVSEYDAEMVKTVALGDTVLTAIVDGVESKLLNTSGKFFGTTVVAGETFDAAAYADLLYTENVASIRLVGPTGLRFVTKIDLDVLATIEELYDVVEYGTSIKPTDWDGDALLVPAYKDVYFEGFDEDETTYHFAGSIVKIKEGNMDRDFAGVGYAKIKLTNGATVTIYASDAKVISVADQAKATLDWAAETGYEFTDAEIDVLEGYAAYVDTYAGN